MKIIWGSLGTLDLHRNQLVYVKILKGPVAVRAEITCRANAERNGN